MEDEIWKTIEEFPNYAISNKGEVINKKTKRILKQSNVGGYLKVSLFDNEKKTIKSIHKLLANTFISNPDNLPIVDHIDNDTMNNSLENLRWASRSLNCHNISAYGKYDYKGVRDSGRKSNPYRADIGYNGKKISLGNFETPEMAAIAYNKKAYEIYGDNARLNVLPDNYYFM